MDANQVFDEQARRQTENWDGRGNRTGLEQARVRSFGLILLMVSVLSAMPGSWVHGCSLIISPYLLRTNELPANAQFWVWHASSEPVYLEDSSGKILEAKVVTTTVPATTVRGMVPFYDDTRLFSTITPRRKLPPGQYWLNLESRGRRGRLELSVVPDELITEPTAITNLNAEVVLEEALVGVDPGCNSIAEDRRFVRLSFRMPSDQLHRQIFQLNWQSTDDGLSLPAVKGEIRGLIGRWSGGGQAVCLIPTWWFRKVPAEARLQLELRPVDRAGKIGNGQTVTIPLPNREPKRKP